MLEFRSDDISSRGGILATFPLDGPTVLEIRPDELSRLSGVIDGQPRQESEISEPSGLDVQYGPGEDNVPLNLIETVACNLWKPNYSVVVGIEVLHRGSIN